MGEFRGGGVEAGGGAKAHHGGKRMHADPGEGGQRARRPHRVSEWVTCVTPRRTLVSSASTAVVPRWRGRSSTRVPRWAGGRSGRPSLSTPSTYCTPCPPSPPRVVVTPRCSHCWALYGGPHVVGTSRRGGGKECVCECVSTLGEKKKVVVVPRHAPVPHSRSGRGRRRRAGGQPQPLTLTHAPLAVVKQRTANRRQHAQGHGEGARTRKYRSSLPTTPAVQRISMARVDDAVLPWRWRQWRPPPHPPTVVCATTGTCRYIDVGAKWPPV